MFPLIILGGAVLGILGFALGKKSSPRTGPAPDTHAAHTEALRARQREERAVVLPPAPSGRTGPATSTPAWQMQPADPVKARRLAVPTATYLREQGTNYDPNRLRIFQRAAGIDADGVYGPITRRTLLGLGVTADQAPDIMHSIHEGD